MMVSFIRRCHETETRPIAMEEVFDAIKSGEHGLKERINQIRNRYELEKDVTGSAEKAKKAIADLKMELPGFLPSGLFSERNNAKLVDYSGILCADLDSLGEGVTSNKTFFKSCPFVRAVAVSPSGDGLKVFFNVINDPVKHEDSFRAIKQFVMECTGLEIDEKCKDPARICFFTYDDDLWVRVDGNESIQPAEPLPRGNLSSGQTRNQVCPPDLTSREQIAFRLLGELRRSQEKGGYFVDCPGVGFHTSKSGVKHTILYLETVPTLSCQHESCAHVVEAFNKVLRSEIGKAEYRPSTPNPIAGINGEEPDDRPWSEKLQKSVVTTSELHGLVLVPRKKLLDEWFCEADAGIIFGPRGSAKTWFTLGLGQALSTGSSFGEWKAHDPVKVLYVDGEMPPDMMRSRLQGLSAINENLLLLNHEILFDRTDSTLNITHPLAQKGITDFCLAGDIKVLILDNLSTLGSGMKENESDSWEQVNNWLLNLRRRKISVIIVHHAGRSGQMRGTSRREDNLFWIISLDSSKTESEETRGVRFISRFSKPSRNTQNEIPVLEWHIMTDEITGLATVSCGRAQTLDVFRAVLESGVTKPVEVAKVMRIEDYEVSRLAKKAMNQGWLTKMSRGEYSLAVPD